MLRSAPETPSVTVGAEPLEFPAFGSLVAEETVAVLTIGPGAADGSTLTSRPKIALAPLAIEPPVQVTVPFVPTAGVVQVKPAGEVMETNRSCAGSTSVITGVVAVFGPLFAIT